MKIILSISFLFLLSIGYSQVSKEYLEESTSDAIVLSDETNYSIKSINSSSLKRNLKVFVKNTRSSEYKSFELYYSDFIKIKKAEITIRNAKNEIVSYFKLKDFEDIIADWSSMANDSRYKFLEPVIREYPCIIEFNYEIEKTGALHMPSWYPQPQKRIRVLNASLNVSDHIGNILRYNNVHVSEPTIEKKENSTDYKWVIKDRDPYNYERFNTNYEDYAPVVNLSPARFEFDGYEGDMSTWESLGKWQYQLNSNKNNLTDAQIAEVKELIKGVEDTSRKVELIYNYLQSNTRYVSIQLGIGGWQPFDAKYVHENKYGDCKALSNYTISLLESVGIKSYYTLIRAGKNAKLIDESFPMRTFNHVIVTVPIEQDTIFLECTSQSNPFGYLGTFTSNRNAVMVTENGGKLIRTKKYSPKENIQSTNISIDLSSSGKAAVSVKRRFTGLEVENEGISNLYLEPAHERIKWLKDNYKWSNASIEEVALTEFKEGFVPETGFEVKMTEYSAAKKMGKRFFLKPGDFVDSYLSKISTEDRKTPIRVRYGYSQLDTINYTLPNYMAIEKGINPVNISTKFGEYELEAIRTEKGLMYIRKLILLDGTYSPEEYQEFKSFVNNIVKHDRSQIVLLDKT